MTRSKVFATMLFSKLLNLSSQYLKTSTMSTLARKMKAVGLYKYLPVTEADSLIDIEVDLPELKNTDVLVEVKATSVNPLDTRLRAPKSGVETVPKILGFDGAGVVVAKGENSRYFNVGDEVFFTGDFRRNGSNAQFLAVDEILVGPKPKNLSFEEAAAMPLTAVTAYESIFDRLHITEQDKGKTLLVINSGGGVGSVASQLAKNFGLKVIGTASRNETEVFSKQNGADIVLNHKEDLITQLEACGYEKGVDYILVNFDPYPYRETLIKAIKPQGLLVDNSQPVDLKLLKDKSLTVAYEMMLTRFKYDTEDKFRHHEILREVSKMLEEGKLKTTLKRIINPINAENLKIVHKMLEDKSVIGKVVLSGFEKKRSK